MRVSLLLLYLPFLRNREGITTEVVPWDDPCYDWSRADLVVVRSTWDYHHRLAQFLRWAEGVAEATTLWNPLPVLRWNTHKGYLRDLELADIPIIPTLWLPRGAVPDLDLELRRRRWHRAVLKPAVGANSHATRYVDTQDRTSAVLGRQHLSRYLAHVDMLVQPFIGSIAAHGERSHVFIADRWSHAFTRQPFHAISPRSAAGDDMPRIDPPHEEVACACYLYQAALRVLAVNTLPFGRIDLVRDEEGVLRLMEVELVEPLLHLDQTGADARLADWLASCLGRPAPVAMCAGARSPAMPREGAVAGSMLVMPAQHAPVEVRPAGGKGGGVFARRDIVPGETVVVGVPVAILPGRTTHSFQMDWGRHVELDEIARSINHSCDANTGVRNNEHGGYDFVALVSIRTGQEITWNYETTEYESVAVERCLCGSATCRGRTRGFRYLSPEERERFGPYIADYLKVAGQVDCNTRLGTPGEEDL